jgi:hypothetical protein
MHDMNKIKQRAKEQERVCAKYDRDDMVYKQTYMMIHIPSIHPSINPTPRDPRTKTITANQ